MISLNQCPMVKIVGFYSLGIGLDILDYSIPLWTLALSLVLYAVVFWRDKAFLSPKLELGISIGIGIVFLCLGNIHAGNSGNNLKRLKQNSLEDFNCKEVIIGGIIEKAPKAKALYPKAILFLFSIQSDSHPAPVQARILLDLVSSKPSTSILPGDTLYAKGYLTTFQSPYPTYRHFIHQQGISYRLYADSMLLEAGPQSWNSWGVRMQNHLVGSLQRVIPSRKEQEIALAMFLGYKGSLAPETRAPFTISGASHILSISGMHIGIIFILLNFFLGFLHWLPQGRRMKNICILLILLLYMVLTGLSPAVVRATLMFGLILLCRIFTVRFQLLNIVACAAMIQLLCDPHILNNVGFQLSYLAVVGILIFFPLVEKLSKTPWKWVNVVYGWMGISLCAGLATAPLVLFHFGTFPVYFILTNLLTTALASAIIWVGFLTVLSLSIPVLSDLLGFLSEQLLSLLINQVVWVSQLPHAQLYGDQMGTPGLKILLSQLAMAPYFYSFFPNLLR